MYFGSAGGHYVLSWSKEQGGGGGAADRDLCKGGELTLIMIEKQRRAGLVTTST